MMTHFDKMQPNLLAVVQRKLDDKMRFDVRVMFTNILHREKSYDKVNIQLIGVDPATPD